MKIWQLLFDVDNYDNFILDEKISVDELQSYDGRKLLPKRNNFFVKRMEPEKGQELGDAPGFIMPVFSEHALRILYPLIDNSVEIINLESEEKGYYAINVLSVIDVIDYAKSRFKTFSDGKRIMAFQRYAFKDNDLLKKYNIFKIIDEPRRYAFVSDLFKQVVEENDLKGFVFKMVWDSMKTDR